MLEILGTVRASLKEVFGSDVSVSTLLCFLQFLSMKLATVNPEVNIDIDRILAKDVRSSKSLSHQHLTMKL